jgi:uncharacterized OB-fold protein
MTERATTDVIRMEPPISRVSEQFWEATRRRELMMQQCGDCERWVWYPRMLCPHCGMTNLEWRAVAGTGRVYAISVQYRAGTPQMNDRCPFAVALIDLDEGVRVMSNVVGCDPEAVRIGDEVELDWEPLSDGRHLMVFKPQGQE